jgi:hypothetical protein
MRPTVGQILSGVALGTVAAAMLVVPERFLVAETGSVPGLALQAPEARTLVRAAPFPALQKPRRTPVQRVFVPTARPAAVAVSRPLPAGVAPPPPARRVVPKPPPPPVKAPPPAAPPPTVDVASVEVEETDDDDRRKKEKKRTWRGDDDEDEGEDDDDDDDGDRDKGGKQNKDDDKPKKEKKRKWRGDDDDD